MFREATQRKAGWMVSFSVFFVTITVAPLSTLDPINVPKLWALLAFSTALGAVLLLDFRELFQRSNFPIIAPAFLFVFFMLVAMLQSDAPLTQQIFGAYGRNTGLLTYVSLSILFIGTALATDVRMAKYFLMATAGAIGVNAAYGLLQVFNADPFDWSNPYSPVIGTTGNPNFMAALLGIGVAIAAPFIIHKGTQIKFKILAALYVVVALIDIAKSDAQQGIIVSLLSLGLIGFFYLRSKVKSTVIRYGYLALGGVVTLIGILGTLQKGPLASIIYKPSVTYRGDYWHAGIEMFKNNPIFGVGLDSFGDWYRASRTLAATLRRGPSTVSNAAHNVFIDFASTAGIFTLLAYLAVIFLGFRSIWRITKRSKNFDPFVTANIVAWIGYLVQSVISINNIALAIWGWVLPGLIIAIDRWMVEAEKEKNEKVKSQARLNNTIDFSSMGLIAGFTIGAVIGFLPFNADANFRQAMEKGDAELIYAAARKWPTNSDRLLYAARVFNDNNMGDKSVDLLRDSSKLNTRSFDSWMALYNSNTLSGNEKREVLDRLKSLDPHNPELAKLS